ncbi:nicotinamide riboside transporter PnuC [Frateuria terrea]|uniref:Nicotinamide riboside transporter PnuC n=1 Tax=Frateuria terrea TaxID=529704 RepID=A0A1H6QTI3_9GAMM|nr:nicotinamide riboside transporter PnuC [Frateuria terrea]SEI46919.1 nicotinamide mononucleotide transporter [Frateuria terrea]SFP12809.1 nicotinamide mononucleotide transporter [Frateuria terrea]
MDAIELVGAALSAWAVWLTARRRPWCWPVGFASVLVYGWIFIHARLYSDALLQAAFAGLIVYGWLRWIRHLDSDGRVQVATLPVRRLAIQLMIGVVGALALGYAMHRWTNAALPWLDAALTAFSLVAQWWQGRRHIAAWWLWIVVDVIYVGEYVYKDLLITAVLYAGFVALAAMGLRQWRRAEHPLEAPAAAG